MAPIPIKKLLFRIRTSARIDATFAIVCGALALSIGIALWSIQFLFAVTTIQQKYGEFNWFSDSCSVAIINAADLTRDEEIFSRQFSFSRARVPMRLQGATSFRVHMGELVAVRCTIDLSSIQGKPEPWVNIGLLSGKSTIFVNRVPVYFGHSSPYPAFFLRPSEITPNTELMIVSRRLGSQNSVGLTGTVPLMYGNGRENLTKITNYWKLYSEDNPLIRLGFATGLILIFFAIWIRGIRYPDVEWMIISLFALCLFPLSQKLYALGIGIPMSYQFTFIYFVEAVSIGGFVIAFTRSSTTLNWYRKLSAVFLIIGIPLFTELDRIFLFKPLMNFILSMVWLMTSFLIAAQLILRAAGKQPLLRRRRLYAIACVCGLGALAYGVQVSFMFSKVILLAPFINYGLVAIFSTFLMTDLVINQNQVREERNSKELKVKEIADLRQQLRIAQSVQQTLLPNIKKGRSGELTYQILYEPYDTVAGDWIVSERFQGGELFLTGDITGKGPAAALAMAAIVGLARSAIRQSSTLDQILTSISRAVLELFGGTVTTTLAMIFIDEDSTLHLCCFGTPPFLLIKFGNVEIINPSGGFVGLNVIKSIQYSVISSAECEGLIYLSDGYLAGARDINALAKIIKSMDKIPTTDALIDAVSRYLDLRVTNINDDKSGFILSSVQRIA